MRQFHNTDVSWRVWLGKGHLGLFGIVLRILVGFHWHFSSQFWHGHRRSSSWPQYWGVQNHRCAVDIWLGKTTNVVNLSTHWPMFIYMCQPLESNFHTIYHFLPIYGVVLPHTIVMSQNVLWSGKVDSILASRAKYWSSSLQSVHPGSDQVQCQWIDIWWSLYNIMLYNFVITHWNSLFTDQLTWISRICHFEPWHRYRPLTLWPSLNRHGYCGHDI